MDPESHRFGCWFRKSTAAFWGILHFPDKIQNLDLFRVYDPRPWPPKPRVLNPSPRSQNRLGLVGIKQGNRGYTVVQGVCKGRIR